MRLRGYVALELGLAAALVWGAGTLGAHGFGLWRGARATRSASSVGAPAERPTDAASGAHVIPPRRQELSSESNAWAGPSNGAAAGDEATLASPGTFLGMADELLLERMRTQPVKLLKLNRGGSSLSFRVDFADGSRAAWKPAQTNTQTVPRKEVAAYRLNRLLGLNVVPPATPRVLSREEVFGLLHPDTLPFLGRIRAETIFGPNGMVWGEASYWIPVIKDSKLDNPAGHQQITTWLTQGEAIPFEERGMAAQLSTLAVFDFLIANPDRHSGGNMKTSGDGAVLYFMDNTMAFFLEPEGTEKNRAILLRTQKFSRRFHQALARITEPTLQVLMHDPDGTLLLTDPELDAVVERRHYVQRYVADLARQFGEGNVLCFP